IRHEGGNGAFACLAREVVTRVDGKDWRPQMLAGDLLAGNRLRGATAVHVEVAIAATQMCLVLRAVPDNSVQFVGGDAGDIHSRRLQIGRAAKPDIATKLALKQSCQ